MNELINLPYCFLFIPLIFSSFSILQNYKITNIIMTILTVAFILLLSFYIVPDLLPNYVLENKLNNNPIFICGEYRIDLKNIVFVIFIFFIKLVSFSFFDSNLIYSKHLNFFFAVYLINYFAICGILLSNNIFNILIYIELYSFCLYSLISNYKNINYAKIMYQYFNNGVLGSLFLIFFTLIVYFNFGSSDISYIRNNLSLVKGNLTYNLSAFILVIALFFKFFSFNVYYSTISKSSNVTSNLFINTFFCDIIIGVYILWKFLYNLFDINILFNLIHFNYFLFIIGSLIIFYACYELYYRRNLLSNLYDFSLITLGYIFILLGLNNVNSFVSIMLLIMNHLTIDFFFYIMIMICLHLFQKSDTPIIYVFYKYKFLVFAIILSKLMFPIGFGFSSSWNYILAVLNGNKYYLILPLVAEKIVMTLIFTRYYLIFSKEPKENYKYLDLFDRISISTNYVILLIFVFSLIIGLSLFDNKILDTLLKFKLMGGN